MGDSKFVYNARFVGRKQVDGPLNDFRLSEVVATFQTDVSKKTVQDEIRCNVEFSDRNLLVTFIKKDEGFESDTESSKSVESPAVEDKSVSAVDEKIIKDHVFRFNESGEDSYSSNSGGSDSETSDHNKSSSAASSASSTPTAELNKYKFDHLDTYSISDVLICHTDKIYKNCVIWVIRKSGTLEALVFECTTEDNARQLYRKFHEVSKRSKLERHRRRKSDGGSIVTRGSELGVSKIKSSNDRGNVTINNIDTSVIEKVVEKNQQKWNLVQHTDKNGVTHIEVESTEPTHLVKPRDNEPRSLVSFSPDAGKFSARGMTRTAKGGDRSKFAKELESILSTEMKRRDEHTTPDRSDSEGSPYPRQRPPGESLSLRQRAPAMLLRKLDEFEEKAHKIWAKAEAEEENRKIWNKTSNSVIGISSPPKGPQLDSVPLEKDKSNQKGFKEKHDRDDNQKNHSQIAEKEKFTSNAIKCKQKDSPINKKDDGNRILIPTKTGKEPPKKLYPKESPPIYGGRFLPLGVNQMNIASQPHSLPIYPVQVGGVAWSRYPAELSQLDLSQSVWKYAQGTDPSLWRHSQVPDMHGRSRSRDRGRVEQDHRRRAQSKSPARRPAGRYMEGVNLAPDISGISRMFREFGGAVRAKMSKKGDHKMSSSSMSDLPDAAQLKSNLKKQRNIHTDVNENSTREIEKQSNNSDKKAKVHFNKFATVQMMG